MQKKAAPQLAGAPNPNVPEHWPANAAPKAQRRVLSEAKASAASFQAKQPKAGTDAHLSASHSLQEAALKLHPTLSDTQLQPGTAGQEGQSTSLDEQPSASHALQAAAEAATEAAMKLHAVPSDLQLQPEPSSQVDQSVSSDEQRSASHGLQAAAGAAVDQTLPEGAPSVAQQAAMISRDVDSSKHIGAQTSGDPTAATGQASSQLRQVQADTDLKQALDNEAHGTSASRPSVSSHQQTGAAAAAAPDEAFAEEVAAPEQRDHNQHISSQQQPSGHDQDSADLTQQVSVSDELELASAANERPSEQQPPEAGSLPLEPFQPSVIPTSASDLEQEAAALAEAGLVPEHVEPQPLSTMAAELGGTAAELGVAELVPEPLSQPPVEMSEMGQGTAGSTSETGTLCSSLRGTGMPERGTVN